MTEAELSATVVSPALPNKNTQWKTGKKGFRGMFQAIFERFRTFLSVSDIQTGLFGILIKWACLIAVDNMIRARGPPVRFGCPPSTEIKHTPADKTKTGWGGGYEAVHSNTTSSTCHIVPRVCTYERARVVITHLHRAADEDGTHVTKAVVDTGCHFSRTEVDLVERFMEWFVGWL